MVYMSKNEKHVTSPTEEGLELRSPRPANFSEFQIHLDHLYVQLGSAGPLNVT